MSKLPNAPLFEVIFELHWPSNDSNELNKFEMSLGAMFIALQSDFPKIVHLRPDNQIPIALFIDKPTHKFTTGDDVVNNPYFFVL